MVCRGQEGVCLEGNARSVRPGVLPGVLPGQERKLLCVQALS